MGVGFSIPVARSAAEARWRALVHLPPVAGLVLCAVDLATGPFPGLPELPPAWRWAAAAACAIVAAGLAIAGAAALRPRPRRRPPAADLLVDEDGRPALRRVPASAAAPMTLIAWCRLPGLTLLVLAPYLPQPSSGRPARPATLCLGRDGMPDDAWRRLQVWLRWIERGRTDRPTP